VKDRDFDSWYEIEMARSAFRIAQLNWNTTHEASLGSLRVRPEGHARPQTSAGLFALRGRALMPNFAVEGDEMKRLACIFRGHRWTIQVENGESYDVCSRCGKQPENRPTAAEEFEKSFADKPYARESDMTGSAGGV
jgi:hypothetical protein